MHVSKFEARNTRPIMPHIDMKGLQLCKCVHRAASDMVRSKMPTPKKGQLVAFNAAAAHAATWTELEVGVGDPTEIMLLG